MLQEFIISKTAKLPDYNNQEVLNFSQINAKVFLHHASI